MFWIKKEFAHHYFYKSDILYRFLKLYQNNKDREDLSTQYHYITNNFPERTLISHLHRINVQKEHNQFEINKNGQYVNLHIEKKYLSFSCKNLIDAEELLFPTLRLFQPLLFIMSKTDMEDYGWISPVQKSSEYYNGQVLYSYH